VPNFRGYVTGRPLSLIGTWVETVAQSLLVLHLTHSGTVLGLITAARYTPILLLLPYAGLLADRHPVRHVLLATPAGITCASDLDDLDIGHGVVIRILSHDRNMMGDGRGRDPTAVDRHLPTCRAKSRYQQRPSLGDGLVDGQRLEPLSEQIG
jgi:hypothetical protein